jgi:hypothetical protein
MLENSYVDIEKSLSKGKIVLALKKSWYDNAETIFVTFFLLSFSFGQFIFGLECIKYNDLPDRIFTMLLFTASLIALFGAYRKLFENKLSVIKHSVTKSNMKRLILNYFRDIHKRDIIENGDCTVIKKEFSYSYKIYTFISTDDVLYFNILNFYPRANLPVIFDHLFLKRDLQKLADKSVIANPQTWAGGASG